MPRTRSNYNQDLAFNDGYIWIPPEQFTATSGTSALTLNAKGDFSANVGASQTVAYIASVKELLRTGFNFITQENYGTSTGPFPGPANSSDPDASIAGYPGGASGWGNSTASQLVPRTTYLPKGTQINDITFIEEITGAALTTHTCGLSKTVFPTAGTPAALVVTDIIAVGANGLPTATNANPQSTKVAVATPAMVVTDMTGLIIALNVTTAVSGAYRLYGAMLHLNFNFN